MDLAEMVRMETEKRDEAQARLDVIERVEAFQSDLVEMGFAVSVDGGYAGIGVRIDFRTGSSLQDLDWQNWQIFRSFDETIEDMGAATAAVQDQQDIADQIIEAAAPIDEDPSHGRATPEERDPEPVAAPVAAKIAALQEKFAPSPADRPSHGGNPHLQTWTAEEDEVVITHVARALDEGRPRTEGMRSAEAALAGRTFRAVEQRVLKRLLNQINARAFQMKTAIDKAASPPAAVQAVTVAAPPQVAAPEPLPLRERSLLAALGALKNEDWTEADDNDLAVVLARGEGIGAAAEAVGCTTDTAWLRWGQLRAAAEAAFGGWGMDAQKNLILALDARARKAAA